MLIYLKKITLAVLPLTGLLLMAPLTLAYDSGREQGRIHDELGEEHQEGHGALNVEGSTSSSQQLANRARRREQHRLAREHRVLRENLNVQHEDYHDGNRYRNWGDDSLSESTES